ncbi:bacillithiol biosynthesis deacetylase BshB1 [Spirosoma aureum]|uniref:Bacillithiol biosynthesis deacetylase BshB1 n=1 Tax=Spirosoma aureum TaxID=2692134 RepID=A0A6G9AU43_9BACT|nr:bacillithiol biosynthesis deacetylase BshB1 [Spirosoma aureum]QIP15846.1 bacillithiol biosynthesis deacetylase BshB1 [Spirosoma aureum]
MKVDVLAIAAHPDDIEMTCGGTILSLVAQGKTVAGVDLTRGELGTRGTPEIRLKESEEGARIMNLVARENMGFRDAFFRNDEEHQMALIPVIRHYQPDIILTNTIDDRHPDHGRAAQLVVDACFYAGLRQIKTVGKDGQPQQAHRPSFIYHFIQDRSLKPDFVVDVSPYWEGKLAAIRAYKSQFFDPTSSEPQSYISGEAFMKFLEARTREHGHMIGVEFGEGFISKRMLGVNDLFQLI